jgi:hypothetical protein
MAGGKDIVITEGKDLVKVIVSVICLMDVNFTVEVVWKLGGVLFDVAQVGP